MLFFSSRQLSRVRVNFTSGSSTTSGLQMFSFILSKVNSWIKFLTLHAVWFYYYNSLYSQREANFQSILILNHPWPFISESAICLDISYWHNQFALLFQCSNNLVSFSAQELVVDRSRDPEGGFGDPYIRISMIPEVDERIRQSSVKRRTHNPFYNEYFKFPVTLDEVKERTLIFQVFDYDKFSRHKTMGEVSVDLGQVDVTNSVEMWCDIQKQSQVNNQRLQSNKITISIHMYYDVAVTQFQCCQLHMLHMSRHLFDLKIVFKER